MLLFGLGVVMVVLSLFWLLRCFVGCCLVECVCLLIDVAVDAVYCWVFDLFVVLRCVLFVINGAAAFPVWGGLLFGCYLFA